MNFKLVFFLSVFSSMIISHRVMADGIDSVNEVAHFTAAGVASNAIGTYRWDEGQDCDGDGDWWYDCDDTWWADDHSILTVQVPTSPSITISAAYLYWSPGRPDKVDWWACEPTLNPWQYPTININGTPVTGPVVGTVVRDYTGWLCDSQALSTVSNRTEYRLHRADITAHVNPGFNSFTLTGLSNGPNHISTARFVGAVAIIVVYDDSSLLPSEKSEIYLADGAVGTGPGGAPPAVAPPVMHSITPHSFEREMQITILDAGLDHSAVLPTGVRPYRHRVTAGSLVQDIWSLDIGYEDDRDPDIKSYDLFAPYANTGNPAESITPLLTVPAGANSVFIEAASICQPGLLCNTGVIDTLPSSNHLLATVIEIKPAPEPPSIPSPVLLREVL